MNWYSFIFSEKKAIRFQRHFLFWLLWGVYFSLSFFHYQQAGVEKVEFEIWSLPFFIKTLLLLLIHLSACYFFIYYLMPHYLFRSKYTGLVITNVILAFSILITSYFLHKTIFPFIDLSFQHQPVIVPEYILWTSISSGLLTAPKVICAAAAIKFLKRWWLKQKEKEKLEKEKLTTDLQLLKAQMHPEFLFSSLKNITQLTERKSIDKAGKSLLTLSDILSYMLYESDNSRVLLEKEIKTIKDYLALEKIRLGDKLELDIALKGDARSKKIVPLLLFPFIENCFTYFGNKKLETAWINLEFQIENAELTMKLIHGKTIDATIDTVDGNNLEKAIKRLQFFYAGNFELKTAIEPEMMMIHLKISLDENTDKFQSIVYTDKEVEYATS
jgi:hypothetical protein